MEKRQAIKKTTQNFDTYKKEEIEIWKSVIPNLIEQNRIEREKEITERLNLLSLLKNILGKHITLITDRHVNIVLQYFLAIKIMSDTLYSRKTKKIRGWKILPKSLDSSLKIFEIQTKLLKMFYN